MVRTKAEIRNLYLNLDTSSRFKVAFGLIFFVQRSLCIAVLSYKISFGVQAIVLQIILVSYASYIFAIRPFKLRQDSVLDILNCVMLIGAQVFQLLLSEWLTDLNLKNKLGMAFDAYMILCFFINACLIVIYTVPLVILKIKRVFY